MSYTQHPPYAVQIEMVQGCNLGCTFCGINALGYQKLKRGKDMMTIELAESIASQMAAAGWCPRVEFAMHGEPTLNPDRATIVGVFRKHLPKAYLMITSNGGGLLVGDVTRNVDRLFDAGLNTLALDHYQNVTLVPRIREQYRGQVPVVDYPDDTTGNPHQRHNWKMISIIADISVTAKGTHSHLNNHAGSGMPLNDHGEGKRCAKPFREMSIRWDGNVALCCNDWPGVYRCGNVVADGLLKVWQGPAFTAARQMLLQGRREFSPCHGCDATSYRVGLLPDPRGKEELPEPDANTKRIIRRAQAQGPYTTPVREPLTEETA